MKKRCDIVIATWNAVEMTQTALASVRDKSNFPYRLILVDNSDQEVARESYRQIAASSEYGDTLLIQNERNIGWLKATNIGIRHADSEYVCLLNNDVICGVDWLRRCVDLIERESMVAVVNPRGNERSENSRVNDIDIYAQELQLAQGGVFTELDRCSGYCMVTRRTLYGQLGLLDEVFDGGYFEDFDFSRRAQSAGYLCAQCDDAFVFHLGSQSFKHVPEGPKRAMHDRNRDICFARWGRPQRLFVRVCNPIQNVDELRALIRKNYVYLLENKNTPNEILEFRHGNLKLQKNKWFWEPLYFLIKARLWVKNKKIDEVRIIYN
jgi:GT2 family glycosyltransferase